MNSYIELGIAAAAPAVMALVLFLMERAGRFDRIPQIARHVIVGIIFGIFAIMGTEWGIPMSGAQINCRDAAVLIAGLLFGGPSGIIAGLIGGIERWYAVAWGVPMYTRFACTVATLLAGVFSALVSHFLLEKKKPTLGMALFVGVAVEVFHMMMVFFTNMNDAENAIVVIRNCTIPMLVTNGAAVCLAVIFISIAAQGKGFLKIRKRSETPVFDMIQRGMLFIIVIGLIATCLFVYNLENNLSMHETDTLLQNAVSDAKDDLNEWVDEYMVRQCHLLEKDIEAGDYDLAELAEEYGVSEISLVNSKGIVTDSNEEDYIGFDMNSGLQSSEFMCLLTYEEEYVQAYEPISYDSKVYRKIAGVSTSFGFLQMSYDDEDLHSVVTDQIFDLADNRHVGQSGYIVIADSQGRVVSATEDFTAETFVSWLNSEVLSGSISKKATIDGVEYYYQTEDCDGYHISALYGVEKANIQRDITIYITIFLIVLVFMAIYILLHVVIKLIIVNQIVKMADSLSMISSGKLDEVVDVQSNEEFASLSKDINRTVDVLKKYIADAEARIDEELELAAKIQLSALPNAEGAFPRRKDIEVYAKMSPAREVGGDFYDFYFTGMEEFNIMVADVSGKGIPAAMFMMRAKSTLKDLTDSGLEVNKVFTEGNNLLCDGNDAEMFVTAWQAKIHLDTGLVEYANAGHNPPLVKHGDKPFEYLKQKRNLVLAAMEDIPYRKNELQLQPGDILLLYTDGVVEATDAHEQLYGDDRLLAIANSQEFASMKDMLNQIRADVDFFVGDAPQFDDLTMLAFKYNGVNTEVISM